MKKRWTMWIYRVSVLVLLPGVTACGQWLTATQPSAVSNQPTATADDEPGTENSQRDTNSDSPAATRTPPPATHSPPTPTVTPLPSQKMSAGATAVPGSASPGSRLASIM